MVSFRQRDKVLALLAVGVALAEVAKRSGVPPRLVRKIGKAANLLPPPGPKTPRPPKAPKPAKGQPSNRIASWQYSLALSMLKSGATLVEAADNAGICPRTAARIARINYLPVRPRGRQRGESGVPLPVRAAVLRMVREGATFREAGEAVGVSRQAVHQWAKEAGVVVSRGRKMGRARAEPAQAWGWRG